MIKRNESMGNLKTIYCTYIYIYNTYVHILYIYINIKCK